MILSLCNRSFAGPVWRDRNRAGTNGPSVSGLIERRVLEVNPVPTPGAVGSMAEALAALSRVGTKDEIGKKAAMA